MHFLGHIQLLFGVILYLPIFTKRQSKNILGNERNHFISHYWTIRADNAETADSAPGSWYRTTAVLVKFWFSDCWSKDFEPGFASPFLQTTRNNDQFHFQCNDPWPCHSAHCIGGTIIKNMNKIQRSILQLKWPDFLFPWEKAPFFLNTCWILQFLEYSLNGKFQYQFSAERSLHSTPN